MYNIGTIITFLIPMLPVQTFARVLRDAPQTLPTKSITRVWPRTQSSVRYFNKRFYERKPISSLHKQARR